jgi:biopolymer transport protein ExbB
VDPSTGSALEHVAYRSTFLGKIKKGGILIWPILAIGLIALLLICERLIFLHKVHTNTDRLMGQVNELAIQGNWAQCHKILIKGKDSPVYNVLRAGLGAIHESRETLESVLNEAILKELPRLERFLPLLSVMAAVAPLLGLLGTVTGMIKTFQVISLYGTGNPRLMAGGISEALVTTMLGLAVAIPVMLAHAFLRRRIEHIAGDMEEKALTLSNIICRESDVGGQSDLHSSRVIAG